MIVLQPAEGGVIIPLRVSPGASRSCCKVEHDGRWRVYVQSPAENGKANLAVCAVVARALGVNKTRVVIISGKSHHDKRARVDGLAPDAAKTILVELGIDVAIDQSDKMK